MNNKDQGEFVWAQTKKCAKCLEVKSVEDFYFERGGYKNQPNRSPCYKSYCKACGRMGDRIMRNKRHQIVLEFTQKNPCKSCGEDDPVVLEFDHRDRATKRFTVSQACSQKLPIKDLVEEMAKCDVLCANCHRRKTAKEMGYYCYKVLHENVDKAEMVE